MRNSSVEPCHHGSAYLEAECVGAREVIAIETRITLTQRGTHGASLKAKKKRKNNLCHGRKRPLTD